MSEETKDETLDAMNEGGGEGRAIADEAAEPLEADTFFDAGEEVIIHDADAEDRQEEAQRRAAENGHGEA
ncbi:MAG TPA: hypothetical protein VD861_10125, partial [Pyrinomonadaceae bacterium]|nr:hypothetical protein [Pyrinomonadaceae bacterium]